MKDREYNLHDGEFGAAVTVRVTSKSRQDEISEILSDGTIHIRLTAPANEEKTNEALVHFLSQVLIVPSDRIEIVAGMGNDRLVTIMGLQKEDVHDRVMARYKQEKHK